MGKITDLVRELDLLAPDIGLNHKGGGGVRTLVGSAIWIICTGVFLGAVGYFFYGFLRTDQPRLEYQYELLEEYPKIDMATSRRIPIIFGYLDDEATLTPSEFVKYATPVLRLQTLLAQTAPNGTLEYKYTDQIKRFIPCTTLFNSKYNHSLFPSQSSSKFLYETMRDFGLCVNWTEGEMVLEGKTVDPFMSYLSFKLMPCMLETGCVSKEELARFSIVHSIGEEVLNYADQETPLKFAYNGDEYFVIDPALTPMATYKLMTNEIWDDRGLFMGGTLRASFTSIQKTYPGIVTRNISQLSCTEEMLQEYTCKPYISFDYISGGGKSIVVRSYIGILDCMSNVGGVREILYFIGFLFYMVYNSNKKKEKLVAEIYDMSPSDLEETLKQDPSTTNKCASKHSRTSRKKLLIGRAFDMVEQSLDVVNLLKSLQFLKLLDSVLLSDYQRALISMAALKQEITKDFQEGSGPERSQLANKVVPQPYPLPESQILGAETSGLPSGNGVEVQKPVQSGGSSDIRTEQTPRSKIDKALETLSQKMFDREWNADDPQDRNLGSTDLKNNRLIQEFQHAVDGYLFKLLGTEPTETEKISQIPQQIQEPEPAQLQQTAIKPPLQDESLADLRLHEQNRSPREKHINKRSQVFLQIAQLISSKSKPG